MHRFKDNIRFLLNSAILIVAVGSIDEQGGLGDGGNYLFTNRMNFLNRLLFRK